MIKRLLFTLGVVVIVALLSVSLASANGGPHGGFTATTDACAGCHRTHTALGPKLRVDTTNTYNLCITCHGRTGTGANANVLDGIWVAPVRKVGDTTGITNTTAGGWLLGGGFETYKGVAVSSSHSPTGTVTAAWGNGVARGATGALASGALDCASCHDPHGSPNYRIVRAIVNNTAVSVAQVDEGVAKDYDTEQWGAGQSNVCAACHGAYHRVNVDQGSTLDAGTYTHRVDMPWNSQVRYSGTVNPETTGLGGLTLPLAATNVVTSTSSNLVVCQTCHLPHGTSSTMSGNAAGTYDPGGPSVAPGPIPSGDSALLRLNNRAVCEVCHQK